MKAVRWLACYFTSGLVPAVEWELSNQRSVAAEVLAAGRSVILDTVVSPLIGLTFEVDRFEWASTRDAYSHTISATGKLAFDPTRARLVDVDQFARVWSQIVRDCARTRKKLYHSEVALGVDRRVIAVAYRAGNARAESMARTVGHWLQVPITPIQPWRQ